MRSVILVVVASLFVLPAWAGTSFRIVNLDGEGEGFNDPTPAEPVGGNPGTTIGEQRLIAFQYAADLWGAILDSRVEVVVNAQFDPLECEETTGVLGSAGTRRITANAPYLPFANTWYPAALANRLAGEDVIIGEEIRATFNSELGKTGCLEGGGFYYGLDNNPPSGLTDFVVVLLHELGHGLGFQSFVDRDDGSYPSSGGVGFPGVYDQFLFDNTLGLTWPQMSNAQRLESMTSENLVWFGPRAVESAPSFLEPALKLIVITPEGVAGTYETNQADFSPRVAEGGLAGTLVVAMDEANTDGPATTDACTAITNPGEVAGRIALVTRGDCRFDEKTANVQAAGAIGVIIENNVPGPPNGMTGNSEGIEIPVVSVAQEVGTAIREAIGDGTASISLFADPADLAGADDLGRPLIYAPDPFEGGSSISHWDTSATPDLLMEPNINSSLGHGVDLARDLFADLGWLAEIAVEVSMRAFPGDDDDGDLIIEPGETARIVVAVQNNGEVLARGTTFRVAIENADVVPGSVTSTQGTGVANGNEVTVTIGDVEVGAEVTITFDLRDFEGDEVSFQGVVEGTNIEPEPTDDPSTAEDDDPTVINLAVVALVAEKTDALNDADGNRFASVGERIDYTITIENVSSSTVTGVRFEDTIDQWTELVSGSVSTTKGTVVTGGIQADAIVDVGTLSPGEKVTITLSVTVRQDVPGSSTYVFNQASITADDLLTVLTDDPDRSGERDATATALKNPRRRGARR